MGGAYGTSTGRVAVGAGGRPPRRIGFLAGLLGGGFGWGGLPAGKGAPGGRCADAGIGVDLDPLLGTGGVYFLSDPTATPKRFIVTWNGVYVEATTRPETFQIILEQNDPTKDGRVILQYKAMNGLTAPLVGIENGTGSS